jgi:hypothetical protein
MDSVNPRQDSEEAHRGVTRSNHVHVSSSHSARFPLLTATYCFRFSILNLGHGPYICERSCFSLFSCFTSLAAFFFLRYSDAWTLPDIPFFAVLLLTRTRTDACALPPRSFTTFFTPTLPLGSRTLFALSYSPLHHRSADGECTNTLIFIIGDSYFLARNSFFSYLTPHLTTNYLFLVFISSFTPPLLNHPPLTLR